MKRLLLAAMLCAPALANADTLTLSRAFTGDVSFAAPAFPDGLGSLQSVTIHMDGMLFVPLTVLADPASIVAELQAFTGFDPQPNLAATWLGSVSPGTFQYQAAFALSFSMSARSTPYLGVSGTVTAANIVRDAAVYGTADVTYTYAAVPEPGSLVLLLGLLGYVPFGYAACARHERIAKLGNVRLPLPG